MQLQIRQQAKQLVTLQAQLVVKRVVGKKEKEKVAPRPKWMRMRRKKIEVSLNLYIGKISRYLERKYIGEPGIGKIRMWINKRVLSRIKEEVWR